MGKDEAIDYIIEFLESIRKDEDLNINMIPLHIEEVEKSVTGTVFGKYKAEIAIEGKRVYIKKDKFFGKWE